MPTLLDTLRKWTRVDCDTLDVNVASELGPFVDCTSNQAIAYFELSKAAEGQDGLYHSALIKQAVEAADGPLRELQGGAGRAEFVVEILMVQLQLAMVPNVVGFVHVQTNPKLSYSAGATVENAERIMGIFKRLAPEFDISRVCIKVPATWEGMQACRILEAKGIATLATTMFCMEQAALAADAGCTYIAPYVNELKVHFEPGYVDEDKAFDFCREAQSYYVHHSLHTQVLAASLTSVDDVMKLAGVHHVTVSPVLLHALAGTDAASWEGTVGDFFGEAPAERSWDMVDYGKLVGDEGAWRLSFARSGFGRSEGKILSAVNYFVLFQEKLEGLVVSEK